MIVISDASPINYLVQIELTELLPQLFDRVVVPPAVVAELSHFAAPQVVQAWILGHPEWLEVIAPTLPETPYPLGLGELAAIRLAKEYGADKVLLDDLKAMRLARRMGLETTGTLGVLQLAAAQKTH